MRKYFYRFFVSTYLSLGTRHEHINNIRKSLRVNLPNQEIYIYENLIQKDGKNVINGLYFDCFASGESEEKIDILINNSVNYVCCVLSLTTLTPYLPPLNLFKYDATKNISERSFIQNYKVNKNDFIYSIRRVDIDLFDYFWKKVDKNPNLNILNAIYQLNRSYQTYSQSDEFITLWLGIEYISSLTYKKENIQKRETLPSCENCNTVFQKCVVCDMPFDPIKTSGAFDGIKSISERRVKNDSIDFKKIYKFRSTLFHETGKFTQEDASYIPYLRELLINCISELLDIEQTEVKKVLSLIPKKQIIPQDLFIMSCKGIIKNLKNIPNIEEPDRQPEMKVKSFSELSQINDDGTIQYQPTLNYNFIGEDGVIFSILESNIIAPDATGFSTTGIKVKESS